MTLVWKSQWRHDNPTAVTSELRETTNPPAGNPPIPLTGTCVCTLLLVPIPYTGKSWCKVTVTLTLACESHQSTVRVECWERRTLTPLPIFSLPIVFGPNYRGGRARHGRVLTLVLFIWTPALATVLGRGVLQPWWSHRAPRGPCSSRNAQHRVSRGLRSRWAAHSGDPEGCVSASMAT